MRSVPAPDRLARLRRGRFSEWLAAALLMAKGYRVLARRVRTPHGEIDIIAVRGKLLAFVEVKRRPSLGDAEASLTSRQSMRIGQAGAYWASRHPPYRDHEQRLDAILVIPRRLPVHLPGALHRGP